MEERIFEITAREVTVDVMDEATGKVCRRPLPLDYRETANGLMLCGKDMDGNPARIAFTLPGGCSAWAI